MSVAFRRESDEEHLEPSFELLQVGERLVGVLVVLRVFAEGDHQHVVR